MKHEKMGMSSAGCTLRIRLHLRRQMRRCLYLYTDQHEAIVSVETFEAAQVLLDNRKHHVRGRLPTMQVIGDGIFRGYVPINHHWMNDDPNAYYQASNSVDNGGQIRRVRRSLFSAFDLEGYQVVRGQFMTARSESPKSTKESWFKTWRIIR